MIRSFILACLGGVRLSDAVEAVCYDRQRPLGDSREVMTPGANMIWQKADDLNRAARARPVFRPAPRMGF